MTDTIKFAVRPAVLEDAEALLAIYAPYVRGTAVKFEYEVPSLEDFRERIRRPLWPVSGAFPRYNQNNL